MDLARLQMFASEDGRPVNPIVKILPPAWPCPYPSFSLEITFRSYVGVTWGSTQRLVNFIFNLLVVMIN